MTLRIWLVSAVFLLLAGLAGCGKKLTVAAERMDRHNNAVGRNLGLMASSYLSARLTCQGWAADPDGPLQLNLNDYHRFEDSPL